MIARLAGCAPHGLLTFAPSTWHDEGWVRIEAAAALPAPAPGEVEVWVHLPEDGVLTTTSLADGRVGLVFPPGSAADRVEWRGAGAGRRVVDVRGDRLDRDGARWHHVYQPRGADPARDLVGVEWPAGDPALAAVAADDIVGAVRRDRADPDAWEAGWRARADCDGCHVVERAQNRRVGEHGLVNRGTDTQGWFAPSTLLARAVPAEVYGRVHAERDDPDATPSCAEGRRSDRCADGTVVTWSFTAARGERARRHCAALEWVVEHLEPTDPFLAELGTSPCFGEAEPKE